MITIENLDINFVDVVKDRKGNIISSSERTESVVIYNVYDFPYEEMKSRIEVASTRRRTYLNIPCAFDIETSTVEDVSKRTYVNGKVKKEYIGFMYMWQFCFIDTVVFGRTWEEFQLLLSNFVTHYSLHENRRLVIYSHYLAFEFQFMRNFVEVESVFARKKRVPMKADINSAFELRCSYFLSNMSLAKFIENTPNARFSKLSGDDFDYRKLRLPNTPLTDLEKGYGYCDVRGLCEALAHLLKEDTIATIALTSTGFLRRDARKVVLENQENKKQVQKLALDQDLYVLCKSASRGGNTHANAIHSNRILEHMRSKDIKSSYPAVMVTGDYPITPFQLCAPTESNLMSYTQLFACLIDITFYDFCLNNPESIPYVSLSKCTRVAMYDKNKSPTVDNGRIVQADIVSMVITDVDFRIIMNHYRNSSVEVKLLYCAKYGKLNKELRTMIMDYFMQKELLNPDRNPSADEYLYAKFKNKINAFFGMMLTDICSPEIQYNPSTDKVWDKGEVDIKAMLDKYYNGYGSFLSYQHGIWVTANARARLQQGLDLVDEDVVYTDTDSIKYLNDLYDHESDFEKLNNEWLTVCEENDIKPYVEISGKRIYLGMWSDDGNYRYFKTLGAKKYCYIKENDKNNTLHVTVAGLAKSKGAKFLMERPDIPLDRRTEDKIGINAFEIDTVVPERHSGRTVHFYNDEPTSKSITINECTFTTGSNVAVVGATYTFGMSDDYIDYLTTLEHVSINSNEDDYFIHYER